MLAGVEMLSEEYIMSLVKKYAASPEGKAEIKKRYGREYDGSGGQALERVKIALDFKRLIFSYIKKHIRSIEFEDMITGSAEMDERGRTVVKISFRDGSLRRDSLVPEKYPDGVENILLHFTHGWNAKKRIRGVWRHPCKKRGRTVMSRKSRNPNAFLQKAVDEFNRSHYRGFCFAELDDRYKR